MYFDLEKEARTNGEFQHELCRRQAQLEQLHRQSQDNAQHGPRYVEAVHELFQYCRFNFVFLTPYFWPLFREGSPLTFRDYPFAWPMFQLQFGGFMVFRGSRQIGKSTAFCARQQLLAQLIPGWKSMYLVPRNQQLRTYANRMREIEHGMKGFSRERKTEFRKNIYLKEFSNGSTIELDYVHTSASRVRGKSADEILFDENQDFDADLEIEITQIQAASRRPVTIYAGTSLTTDTMLEKKWSESSQGLWVTRCPACGHQNIPLPDHGVLDMIQRAGPACAKCAQPIDVRTGQFIHGDCQKRDAGCLGFHIPQIVLPSVVNNPARWARIYEMKVKQGGNRKFLQEVLGIAVEEGEREITRQNLIDLCTLGRDLSALQRRAAQGGAYDHVISAADWGGSDYVPAQHLKISTTVHVIMGVTGTGELHLLHIRRYGGMNYDDIVGDILHNHFAYGATAMASDFGVGAVYNSKLREKIPPERHLIFAYVGPASALLSEPRKHPMFNQWSLNRTESISLTFDAIRKKRIRCFAWELAEEYLSDCLNLFRAPGERQSSGGNSSGASTFLYRAHSSKPNDALMAINYAHMLAKLLLGEPMFADLSLQLRLQQTLCSNSYLNVMNLPGAISG